MDYSYTLLKARFVKRPNRFIAHILLDGKEEVAHVPNTGRLKELLYEGAEIAVSHHPDPKRKTKYEVRLAKKNGQWFSVDSQIPNHVAADAIAKGEISGFEQVIHVHQEKKYGNSRFDLHLAFEDQKEGFVEVKGVTLEQDGVSMFPDAPTTRGTKHVRELIQATKEGYACTVLFLLQFEGATMFRPHWERDPDFCQAVVDAAAAGVSIRAVTCIVDTQQISVDREVPVVLEKPDHLHA